MGYYADGSGSATIKKGYTTEDIEKILESKLSDCNGIEYNFNKDLKGNDTIDIMDYDKYYEDETMEFLEAIAPYITEGFVAYNGEDDEHWRFVFDATTQTWNDEYGTVDYDFESYSDDDLIAELNKRGYKVTKKTA